MKRFTMFFMIVAAAAFFATAAMAQGPFKDVPADHWAYAAVKMLKDNGLMEGYPDGTFQGTRNLTRYEMAQLIARVWYKVEDMIGAGNPPSDDIMAQIEKLANEFRSELADLGVQVDNIMATLDELQSEVDRLKSMIHDTNLSGNVRFRTGGFVQNNAGLTAAGAPTDIATDVGHELYGNLNLHFAPNDISTYDMSFVYAETHGLIAGMVPSASDGIAKLATPPGNKGTTDIPELDVAKATFDMSNWLGFFGETPTFTIGRQYFSFGEFGLSGDNGFWSDFGFRLDTSWGENWDFTVGAWRIDDMSTGGAFTPNVFPYGPSRSYQNTNFVTESDDYVSAYLGYSGPEGTVPGHDHAWHADITVTPWGYGEEFFVGGSANFEIPWMAGGPWINGIRGEGVWTSNNAFDRDPDALGFDNISWVSELDIYNDGNTKFAGSYAQISQLEAIPVYANVDNDPFSEWDYTVAASGDAFNISREGKNFFPADFNGFGASLEHTFGNGLYGKVYFYDGERRNSRLTARPGVLRFMFRYPIYDNTTVGLDVINGGLTDGLDDTNTLVRGELLVNF